MAAECTQVSHKGSDVVVAQHIFESHHSGGLADAGPAMLDDGQQLLVRNCRHVGPVCKISRARVHRIGDWPIAFARSAVASPAQLIIDALTVGCTPGRQVERPEPQDTTDGEQQQSEEGWALHRFSSGYGGPGQTSWR
jgi:hypothetical protein